jgi:septin family protein
MRFVFSSSWQPIAEYIEEQHFKYFTSESGCGAERRRLQDTRVHCCLYFLPPNLKGLRPIDVEAMRKLGELVNILPVIARADSLTKSELNQLKEQVDCWAVCR